MQVKYNIEPSLTHQTIMVDVLARSGKIKEAEEFIEREIKAPSIFLKPYILGY